MGDEKLMRNWLRGMPVVRGCNLKWLTFSGRMLYMQKMRFLHQMTQASSTERKEKGERV